MPANYRLTILLILSMLSICSMSYAQSAKESKVTIEMTYEDKDGKKLSETIEYVGEKAESFDADEFEKSLEKRNIKILNLNINQSLSESTTTKEDIEVKGDQKTKAVIIKKVIITDDGEKEIITESMDSDSYEVEEKDGKIFLNGKEIEGGKKQIRIMKSSSDVGEMNVEVKEGKVFINGEEVDDSEMSKSSKHRVIIKKMGEGDEENIWISDDGESHELHKKGDHMIFISDDDAPQKPRLGIMIEDGKSVNGAEIVDLVPDSPAAKAGLQKGDTITSINDDKVYGVTSMMDKVSNFKQGDEVVLTYDRAGQSMTAKIKLAMMKTEMTKSIFIKEEKK